MSYKNVNLQQVCESFLRETVQLGLPFLSTWLSERQFYFASLITSFRMSKQLFWGFLDEYPIKCETEWGLPVNTLIYIR